MPASCGEAHLYNCMQLGKALRAKGHTVAFTVGTSQLQKAKDFGVGQIYPVVDSCYLANSEWDLFNSITEPDYLKQCLSEEKAIIKKFKPGLIVTDFRLTVGISAQLHNLPWVSMLAQLWYLPGYRSLLKEVYNRSGLDDVSVEGIDSRFQELGKKLSLFLKKIKIPEITDLMQAYISPVCTLLRTIPSFLGSRALPENFHVVGPFFPRRIKKQPNNRVINQLRRHGIQIEPRLKTVILRLSGIINDKRAAKDLVHALKDRFRNTKFQLLICGQGPKTTCDNVLLASFLPFDLLFQLEDVVLISNGGLNTTSQAMAWGVPHLVIPTQVENEYNAFIAKELRVAEVLLPLSKAKPEVIFENIDKLFTNRKYKLALKKSQKYFADFPGVSAAIKCLKTKHLI